jgi:four helix bundle protein
MGIKRLGDVIAFTLALEFKRRVYGLMRKSPDAWKDLRYRSQLFAAVGSVEANIAEGWRRFVAGEINTFLRYALGSLEEAKCRLRDGVDRGYFTAAECDPILEIGNRCGAATMGLWKSLQPFQRKSRGK